MIGNNIYFALGWSSFTLGKNLSLKFSDTVVYTVRIFFQFFNSTFNPIQIIFSFSMLDILLYGFFKCTFIILWLPFFCQKDLVGISYYLLVSFYHKSFTFLNTLLIVDLSIFSHFSTFCNG